MAHGTSRNSYSHWPLLLLELVISVKLLILCHSKVRDVDAPFQTKPPPHWQIPTQPIYMEPPHPSPPKLPAYINQVINGSTDPSDPSWYIQFKYQQISTRTSYQAILNNKMKLWSHIFLLLYHSDKPYCEHYITYCLYKHWFCTCDKFHDQNF